MKVNKPLTLFKVLVVASWLFVSCSKQESIFFDIPEGNAGETLGEFASQSSNEIIFNFEEMDLITTNRVYGTFTCDDALQRMLDGTTLTFARDEKSGAIAIWNIEAKKNK